jgi:hypothetical protein
MKLEQISTISNPKEVYRKFKESGYDEYTNIYVSNRKDKKYMIIEPYTNMMVNFGSTMADYSFHKDENGDRALLKGMLDGSI